MKPHYKRFSYIISFFSGVLITIIIFTVAINTNYSFISNDNLISSFNAETCGDSPEIEYGVINGETTTFYEMKNLTRGIVDFCSSTLTETEHVLYIKR